MNPIISISNLSKTYVMDGDIQIRALDNVSIDIEQGSFIVAMGPSGSGKSTLMQIVGGLDRPTSGRIEVGGELITRLDEHQIAAYRRRMIGFVFQSFNLMANMTALENVALPLRLNGIGKKDRLQRAFRLLCLVGLKDRLYHRPTQLSGGQQQRIAIARALANDPPIIMADEPTGNLDSASGEMIMEMLSDLNQHGRTIFVVSHDPRMSRYAHRVINMLDGRIISSPSFTPGA
jgi:putative ABC transport system ATP-binding protein